MADKGLATRLRLNFLISHLDLTVDNQGWKAGDEVGALALSTIHERVLGALLLEVILLLGTPWARIRAVHGHAWTARGAVLFWGHELRLFAAGLGHVRALGAQPPLVDVKAEHAEDDGECDTHNNRITIHFYCTLRKRNQAGGAVNVKKEEWGIQAIQGKQHLMVNP